jgi:hypothetical protein
MKYMLLMYGSGKDVAANWPEQDIRTMINFMIELNEELAKSGELVDAQGLADEVKVVRAQAGGPPAVTDGPFPETKEVLAGYWVLDVASPERIVEIAARISATPGPGGELLNQPIEVRPIGTAPEV